jgi:hypothetical protein
VIDKPFAHHLAAALALLNNCPNLSHMEAGFLGHVCVTDTLTGKQREWLGKLLRKNGLPALADEMTPGEAALQ